MTETPSLAVLWWKRELISLLSLSSWCLLMVVWLFLVVPWVCLQFVIVVFLIILTILSMLMKKQCLPVLCNGLINQVFLLLLWFRGWLYRTASAIICLYRSDRFSILCFRWRWMSMRVVLPLQPSTAQTLDALGRCFGCFFFTSSSGWQFLVCLGTSVLYWPQ